MTTRIYAGAARGFGGSATAHGGLFRRALGDTKWQKLGGGLPAETEIHAIAVHPGDPQVVYAGTQEGPYRSTDGGDRWTAIPFPDGAKEVWSFLFDPHDARVMYAGTSPAAVYKSDNGGDTWRKLGLRPPGHVKMSFDCRVTRLAADPSHPRELYAGLEVDGVLRSRDGGDTWEDMSQPLIELADKPHLKSRIVSDTEIEGMMDTHALCVSSAAPGTVFLAVRMGVFRSADRGVHWEDMEIGRFSPLTYSRDICVSPHNPRTLFTALSPAARSEDGSLYRTDDLGGSWKRVDRGIKARATMMSVALHPKDPDQIYCVSRCGQVFGTQDGGAKWQEYPLPEGTADAYTVACA